MADFTVVEEEQQVSRRRMREQGRAAILSPLEQVRMAGNYGPGVDAVGANAYYIRLDGATISDALVLNPNGGKPPVVGDEKQMRRRKNIANNAEYFQARTLNKRDEFGQPLFEYVGHSLTESAVKRLVEVIVQNREDEILYVKEGIEEAELTWQNAERPEYKAQARKRKAQLQKRLAYLEQEIEPERLLAELNEISRAQRLRNLPAGMLSVINEIVGDSESRIRKDLLDRVSSGRATRAYSKGMRPATNLNLGEVDDE